MKNKALTGVISCFIAVIICIGFAPLKNTSAGYTDSDIRAFISGIDRFNLGSSGCNNMDEWVSAELPKGVGINSEWYAVALSQSGTADLSRYEAALLEYLDSHKISSASTREKFAAALCAVGSDNSSLISEIAENSIEKQGLMSRVFGLHLITNGCVCSKSAADVTDWLLSKQLDDGGWSVTGKQGDVDATAMTVQALAPYYSDAAVIKAVDRALALLSSCQQTDGGFSSMGIPNPESASQVLTALSALGIDCLTDSRFIKDGSTVIDGILKYRLPDGSFTHTENGSYNATSTVQAYYSFIAYLRMKDGKGSFWVFDNSRLHQSLPPVTTTAATTTVTSSTSSEELTVTSAAVTETANIPLSSAATTETVTSAVPEGAAEVTSQTETIAAVTSAVSGSTAEKSSKALPVLIVLSGAAVLSLFLVITGKRSPKNFIAVGIAAAAGIALVLLIDIKTPDKYYDENAAHKENAAGSVRLTIRCDAVIGKSDKDYIPSDGIILAESAFDIEKDETVLTLLSDAAKSERIQIDGLDTGYISGINYIYEFDFGEFSGWMYRVNGEVAPVGCGEYRLGDGDLVEWLYTCDLGKDLEEVYGNGRA